MAASSEDAGLVLDVAAVTHRGGVRTHNEDTIAVAGWICGDSMAAPRQSVHEFAAAGLLLLVADGMGGHAGGREASRRAAQALVRLLPGDGAGADVPGAEVSGAEVPDALRAVNRELFAAGAADPALRGMGTTVAGIVARAGRTVWFNVGDSRVYSVRREYLRQLSVDDVPAWTGPDRGGITQALGGADRYLEIRPHVGSESTRAGRRYLLCSDGLTHALPLETLERVLLAPGGAGDHVAELLERSLAAGAPDDVSIVLASVRERAEAPEAGAASGRSPAAEQALA